MRDDEFGAIPFERCRGVPTEEVLSFQEFRMRIPVWEQILASNRLLVIAREPHTAEKDSLAMGSLRGQGVVMSNYGLLLRDHVTLRCRSIDRIFLQAYVPRLQAVGEVCTFLRWQRKFPIPSSAAFGKIGEEYVKAVHRFAEAKGIPVVYFKKGQNKEEVAGPYLQAAAKGSKGRLVAL